MPQKDSNVQPFPPRNDADNHQGSRLSWITQSVMSRPLPIPCSLSPWVLLIVHVLDLSCDIYTEAIIVVTSPYPDS